MAAPVKKKRVTLDTAMLSTMAANARFVKEFQFLSRLTQVKTKKKGGCGGCSRKATADLAVFNAAKQAIAAMGPAKKLKLKEMLNTEQVAVFFSNPSGKREDRFF